MSKVVIIASGHQPVDETPTKFVRTAAPVFQPRPLRTNPCIHLGMVIEKKDVHGQHINCRGKWKHSCDLYGECRINDPRANHNCMTCVSYSDEREPDLGFEFETRHLLYHIYPTRERGTWQRNLDNLRLRLPLFNGKKVIAIVTDDKTDPAGAVEQYLSDSTIEYIHLENNPTLREVVSWVPLWERVIDLPGATFYAHAKAVGRPWNPGVSCHLWTDIMYETLLDYPGLVKLSLQSHPLTGTFKKEGRGFSGCTSRWHYSGSFFWARNDLLRQKPWRDIPQQWWGNEAMPGVIFDPKDAGCIFHEGRLGILNIYDPHYLNKVVIPDLREWRKANQEYRTEYGQPSLQ